MINQTKILVFIGPPGVGKGFYSVWLQKNYPFASLSSGDIARNLAQSNTTLGKKVYQTIKAGKLLAPQLINALVFQSIKTKVAPYLILDGYPRNLKQLKAFLANVNLDKLIFCSFSAPYQLCYKRVQNRQFCSQCGAIYNLQTNPSKVINICNNEQAVLKNRIDADKFQQRYSIFRKETLPMLAKLKKQFSQCFFEFLADDISTGKVKNQLQKLCASNAINKL